MKKVILLLTLSFSLLNFVNAQNPPNAFNYSAVARNAAGQPIATTTIGIQITILKSSPTGALQYSENHFVNTDAFGLFNLVIGAGAVQNGSMATIDWSNDNYYLKVGMDAAGGNNFLIMGTTQLLSVPYALHAKTAESLINNTNQSFAMPTVLTTAALNIQPNSATVTGTINPNGLLTDNIQFEYGTTTAYGNIINASTSFLSGNASTQVNATLLNLLGNTTYHYRLKAKNAIDYNIGNDFTFTTASGQPIINQNSLAIDSISQNIGRFQAYISPNGSLTTVTFQYGPTASLGNSITCSPSSINGSAEILIQSNLVDFTSYENSYVYFRCIATNSFGTVVSDIEYDYW